MIQTDGNWDKSEKGIYFLALSGVEAKRPAAPFRRQISALAELGVLKSSHDIERLVKIYKRVMVDSGVFSIVNAFAKRAGISFNEAFSQKLADIPKSDQFLRQYIDVCTAAKNCGAWGFVEIDLGGKDEKIKTRQLLHDNGLSPIPVYHPLVDGPEYLDYLIDNYDRICISNLVQSLPYTRSVLVSYAYRKIMEKPPEQRPYIHFLGVGASVQFLHFHLGSCDASSWSYGRRVGKECVYAYGQSLQYSMEYRATKSGKSHDQQANFEMIDHGLTSYEQFYNEIELYCNDDAVEGGANGKGKERKTRKGRSA